jgi:chemotaxis receptor (MCP) glutamine deamidase CheD
LVQPRDDVPRVRTVSKRTMRENDVELVGHDAASSNGRRVALSPSSASS